ncbi:MAG: hypothetical protein HDR04_18945 [Lachnospiraceae bacterium]|nr:hypothetical protein [Lachnospiraceae bacterium]
MDNIIFKKVWQDDNLIELEISNRIQKYIDNCNEPCYLEFGKKEGNYTPAFSMCILLADTFGHVQVEVDIEIIVKNAIDVPVAVLPEHRYNNCKISF